MALSSLVGLAKGLARHMPLSRQARMIRAVLPRSQWFRAALAISNTQGCLVQATGGNGALTSAVMLDHWLRELSFGGAFPIPYKTEGFEICLTPGAKMYCWTHLPLTEIPLRVYLENGGAPLAVVADRGKIVEQSEFLVFGWPERMQAIPVGLLLLSRVKTALRSGKSVVFLADEYMGAPLSEMPVRLAGRLSVPLIFQWAELLPNGTIQVTYRYAPYPYSRTEEEIAANLRFLREAKENTLGALGFQMARAEQAEHAA